MDLEAVRRQRIEAFISALDESILLADGLDEAFIGIGRRCASLPVAVYDADKCVEILMDQGMTQNEAQEFFDFNVAGSFVGEQTPIFVSRLPRSDDD